MEEIWRKSNIAPGVLVSSDGRIAKIMKSKSHFNIGGKEWYCASLKKDAFPDLFTDVTKEFEDFEGEIWKDHPKNNMYQISNMGRALRKVTKNGYVTKLSLLIPSPVNDRGDIRYSFAGRGGSRYATQLVYETFVGPIPENHKIIHIDGNVKNNALTNLKLVDGVEYWDNVKARRVNKKCKYPIEIQKEIAKKHSEGMSYPQICKEYNISLGCAYQYYIKHKDELL